MFADSDTRCPAPDNASLLDSIYADGSQEDVGGIDNIDFATLNTLELVDIIVDNLNEVPIPADEQICPALPECDPIDPECDCNVFLDPMMQQ